MASSRARRPRARRDLSLDEIAQQAAEILRAQGEGALSMRRVAEACGVTPMALYHHVDDKDALIDAVMDVVLAPMLLDRDVDPSAWRDELVGIYRRFRRALVDNPGAGTIFVRRPVVNHATALVTEQAFRLLAAAGLNEQAVPRAMDALVLVLIGSVANDLTRPPDVRERLGEVLDSEPTPMLDQHLPEYATRDAEARFCQAIEWMLDGLLADSRNVE